MSRSRTFEFHIQAGAIIRVENHDGRSFLVAPIVMLVEGVVNGELATLDAIRDSVPAWNGRPVLLNHPKVSDMPVSANSPEVWEQSQVGFIFKTHVEGDRLKAEIWLDVEKIEGLGGDAKDILGQIRRQEKVEISTGYFARVGEGTGTFKGKRYNGIQHLMIPDHLALLTDEEGACNWSDGCGAPRVSARQQTQQEGAMTIKEQLKKFLKDIGWKVQSESVVREVKSCDHCGEDHKDLQFVENEDSSGAKQLVGVCPDTQTPIIVNAENKEDDSEDKDRIKVNGQRLGSLLKKLIGERALAVQREESALINQMSEASDLPLDFIQKVLAGGVDFPSRRMLQAFAGVLEADVADLYITSEYERDKYRGRDNQDSNNTKEVELKREDIVDALSSNEAFDISDEVKAELLALEKDEDFYAKLGQLQAVAPEGDQGGNADEGKTEGVQDKDDQSDSKQQSAGGDEGKTNSGQSANQGNGDQSQQKPAAAEPKNLEQWITDCPDADYREHQMQQMVDIKQERKELTERLTTNGFTEDEVKVMSLSTLRKFSEKLSPTPNYSGGRFAPQPNNGAVGDVNDIPDPPPVLLAARKEA